MSGASYPQQKVYATKDNIQRTLDDLEHRILALEMKERNRLKAKKAFVDTLNTLNTLEGKSEGEKE